MLPFIFEWVWDPVHVIFMGGLFYALTIMGLGVTYCVFKAAVDSANDDGSHHEINHDPH